MKNIGITLTIILVIIGLYAYLKNDGIYVLSNINNTELDWINKYAIYDTEFPDETIVENFAKADDIDSYFFSHNEYIKSTILVPNDKIDDIFPESLREYNKEYILDLSHGKENEKVQFAVWMPRTVIKWFDKTDRAILFTIMQSGDKYTKVYVFIDKLGWNLYHYNKPTSN